MLGQVTQILQGYMRYFFSNLKHLLLKDKGIILLLIHKLLLVMLLWLIMNLLLLMISYSFINIRLNFFLFISITHRCLNLGFIELIWLQRFLNDMSGWHLAACLGVMESDFYFFLVFLFIFKYLRQGLFVKEVARPCSFSHTYTHWVLWLFFFLNPIQELVDVILILERIAQHIEIRRFSSLSHALSCRWLSWFVI